MATPDDATGRDPDSAAALADRARLTRYAVQQQLGLTHNGARDLYDILGYEEDPDTTDYRGRWERGDIAETLVNAPAATAWRDRPDIVDHADAGTDEVAETEFERAVDDLFDDHDVLHYLERWDKAIGLGQYGLLMLGLAESDEPDADNLDADGPSLDDPAEENAYDYADLAYLSIFTQSSVVSINFVTNPMHERFDLPQSYRLELNAGTGGTRTADVHYTRVLHGAEELLDSEVYGKPRLKPVLNRLRDREKILGGSAEAYWRSADRRIHLDYDGDASPPDADDVAEQAEEMIHGLRSVLTTQRTDLNSIEGSDPDPTGALDGNTAALSGQSGIPKRILTGSERGELASTQDRATFYGRIMERREQFCGPMMLRPLLDRLIDLGVLPAPAGDGYDIEWPELFELNELERAELMNQKAQALKNAAPMGDPGAIATDAEIRENIFGWDPELGEETSLDPSADPELIEDDENEVPVPPRNDDGDAPPDDADGDGPPPGDDDVDLGDVLERIEP